MFFIELFKTTHGREQLDKVLRKSFVNFYFWRVTLKSFVGRSWSWQNTREPRARENRLPLRHAGGNFRSRLRVSPAPPSLRKIRDYSLLERNFGWLHVRKRRCLRQPRVNVKVEPPSTSRCELHKLLNHTTTLILFTGD